MRLALVIVGGGLGSGARYLIGLWAVSQAGTAFPWGTLAVNLSGSFLIGLIATLADESGSTGPNTRLFLVAGVLGGFTTFSAFSLESWRLFDQGDSIRALLYVVGSVGLGLAGAIGGVALARIMS
ncbi:MAG: fluoride efflux transporter CrcB [Tepidiformaceae bacterium]